MRRNQDSREISLFTVVEAIFRHIALFLVVAVGVLALALWWIFYTPRKYESQASILVQNARSNILISAGSNNGPTMVKDVTEEELNSELEVLTSKDLLDEVIEPGWKSKLRSDYSADQLKEHEDAVMSLSHRLDTSVVRKSHVLLVTLTAPTPQAAQEQMQHLIAAFIARQRQIGRPAGVTHFFAEQAARYKDELAAAQAELAEFQVQQNMVSVNDRESTLSSTLSTAEALRRDADAQIGDLETRIQTDTALLAKLDPRQTTVEHTAPLSGALDTLTTQLVTLKNQRTDLLNKFHPTDRMVTDVEAQIAETEAGIRAATAAKSQDASTNINPTWQQLETDMTMTRAQLSGVRARREVLTTQIGQMHESLDSAEGLSPEFTALQHKVTELDNNYQTYLQKRDEAEIADSMDRQDLLNFAVVESPTYSAVPVHPKPKRDTLLGVVTALLLGGIAVFLLESTRDTVANAYELERWSRYPVLATVPLTEDADLFSVPHSSGAAARDKADREIQGNATRVAV
jgi:uncharacterized protein involved in exopolysaccharide biosynthesis